MTKVFSLRFLGEKNLKVEKIIFDCAWIMMVIHICVANSSAAKFSNPIISYMACLLFVVKIIYTNEYSLKEMLIMCLMCVIGVLSLKASRDMRVLWFALVLSASKDIDFKKIVRKTLFINVLCCIAFYIMYLLNIIPGDITQTMDGELRYGFGLGHPNMCSAYYAMILLMFLYLYYKNIKIYHYAIFLGGAFLFYSFTKSRTGLLLTIIILFMFAVLSYIPDILKKKYIIILTICIITGMISFTLMPLIYTKDNTVLVSLNGMLTGRLAQGNYFYEKYGISLFGKYLEEFTWHYKIAYLDNGYAKMLINNGFLYYFMVVCGYIATIVRSFKRSEYSLLLLCFSMIIYMFTENVATYIFANVSMLVFSKLLFKKRRKILTRVEKEEQ